MSSLVIVQQMCVIGLLVILGMFLGKKEILGGDTSRHLSWMVVNVTNPCTIISCVLSNDIAVSHSDFLLGFFCSLLFFVALMIAGRFLPILFPVAKDERKFYNLMIMYTNMGFIGIPLANAILSPEAMIYIVLLNILFCVFFYTQGISLIGGSRFRVKKLISPGTIFPLIALILFWFGIKLPTVLTNTITYIANATVFLSMILLGASLSPASIRAGVRRKGLWVYVLVRMLAFPVGVYFLMKAFRLPIEMIRAFCLMSMMPAANMPLIQAEAVGESTEVLSEGIVVTTLLCFFTVTALMSFLF